MFINCFTIRVITFKQLTTMGSLATSRFSALHHRCYKRSTLHLCGVDCNSDFFLVECELHATRVVRAQAQNRRCGARPLPASPPGLERLLTKPASSMSYLLQPPRSVPTRLLTPRCLPPLSIFFMGTLINTNATQLMPAFSLKQLFSRRSRYNE